MAHNRVIKYRSLSHDNHHIIAYFLLPLEPRGRFIQPTGDPHAHHVHFLNHQYIIKDQQQGDMIVILRSALSSVPFGEKIFRFRRMNYIRLNKWLVYRK